MNNAAHAQDPAHLQVLKDARELLSNPERWFQGGYFPEFDDCSNTPYETQLEHATCFCALGALAKVTGDPEILHGFGKETGPVERARNELQMTLALRGRSACDSWGCPQVAAFNDRPTTTHEDVLGLYDETIKRVEAEHAAE